MRRRGRSARTTGSPTSSGCAPLAARLIGTDADGVALVPASSYGLAIAARNLTRQPGDRILVLADEFPSNHYTWQRFRRGHRRRVWSGRRGRPADWTAAVLRQIDDRTRIVAVPNVHWTNGALVDLGPVAAAAPATEPRW